MLKICEKYADDHNLEFSTDDVPARSKSKCVYFCGRLNKVNYPDPLELAGRKLPWVINADHLGHTLCQTVTMDKDCHRARSKFIMRSTEVRESLVFSHPFVTLKAIQSLCMDAYGAMIWDLGSSSAEQFFKCWNTCVKMVYNVPRNTFTYLVEGFLAANYVSLRNQVLARYGGFYRRLATSPSREVRGLVKIVQNDPRSNTGRNLRLLRLKTGMDYPEQFSSFKIKGCLKALQVPKVEEWRLGLLVTLFEMRSEKLLRVEDTKGVTAMIDSLCST